MERLVITLLVGSVGGIIGYLLKLTAGALLGSMVAVGVYNCLGFQAVMPPQVRIGVQVVVGCMLGLNLNRAAFAELKTVLVPAIVIISALLIFGLITGFIVYKVSKLDVPTAFLSSSAGGMTELSLLAVTLGADGPKVAILHSIRMITVVSVMPSILNLLLKIFPQGK
jgi:membrane AbrB-like protein